MDTEYDKTKQDAEEAMLPKDIPNVSDIQLLRGGKALRIRYEDGTEKTYTEVYDNIGAPK